MGTWHECPTVNDPEVNRFVNPRVTVPALRWTAIVETASFVLLMTMVILDNRSGVRIVGMTHGMLFLAYVALVLAVRRTQRWSWGFTTLAVIAGPVGALIVPQRLRDPASIDSREVALS